MSNEKITKYESIVNTGIIVKDYDDGFYANGPLITIKTQDGKAGIVSDYLPIRIKFSDGKTITEFDKKGNRNYYLEELNEITKKRNKDIIEFGYLDLVFNDNNYDYIDKFGFFHSVTKSPEGDNEKHVIGETMLINHDKVYPLVAEPIIETSYEKRESPLNPEFYFDKEYYLDDEDRSVLMVTIGYNTIFINGKKIRVYISFKATDCGTNIDTKMFFGVGSIVKDTSKKNDAVTFKTKRLEGDILKKYNAMVEKHK